MDNINLFNIQFTNIDQHELIHVFQSLLDKNRPSYILTCNVDHIIQVQKDHLFRKIYSEADIVLCDGVPIYWMSKILNKPLKQKLSGSDLLDYTGADLGERHYKLFLLGAAEGVAKKAGEVLEERFKGIEVVGSYSPPYGFENDKNENKKILEMIKESKPDILLVGLGAPKQEKWIYDNYLSYNVPISIGVGATFDFIAGNVKRAPLTFQKIGLEWFWRLMMEPKRLWKRYLIDDSRFLTLAARELLKSYLRRR